MKVFLTSFWLLTFLFCFSQSDSTTLNFLNDVVKRNSDSSLIYYTDKVDAGMYSYMIEKKLVKRRIKDISSTNKANLTLTNFEITQLKQNLANYKFHQWPEKLFTNSKRISSDSTLSFLSNNKNNDLYLFSKPAFIRNNTIGLFYVVRLCCGGINGPVDLSFYRRENGKWQRWITIGGGAF